jgi:hypothetical protein
MKIPTAALTILLAALAAAHPAWGATPPAKPRWESVLLNDQGLFYIEPGTIKDQGERKEVWSLLDYKKPQSTADGKPYLSTQALILVNCKARMARIMHLTYYSGAMLSGQVMERQGMLQDWHEIEKGTAIQRIARRIC